MNNFLNLFLKGIFVGIANIIPGVSGGTIAVVLRIFDEMIEAINNFFKEPKKYFKFLLPLILGAVLGILLFSKLLKFLLLKDSLATNLFFVGLVLGSVPLIYSQAKKREVKPYYFLVSALSFFVVFFISLIKPNEASISININTAFILRIVLSGIIASSAMVIPGISGSFVLVLLGLYNIVLTSISDFLDVIKFALEGIFSGNFSAILEIFKSDSFIILFSVGIGVILGIVLISKLIEILLKKAFSLTYFVILGLIFGSVFAIFKDPITYQSYNGNIPIFSIILGIITLILGFFVSIKLSGKE